MSRVAAACLLALATLWAPPAPATESVTIRMFLSNLQAKAVRDAKGQPVTIRLSADQVALIKVRAPKFKGHIIRAAAHQVGSANTIKLTIFKPDSNTPVLRVVDREAPIADERRADAAARAALKKIEVELEHLTEKLAALDDRLAALENQLRAE